MPRTRRQNNPPSFQQDIVLLDPKKAKEILELSDRVEREQGVRNRNPAPSVVERYSEMMTQGLWSPYVGELSLTNEGRLIDGQHRLLAILKSNTTQWMVVRRGVPAETIDLIDTGRRRTISDISVMTARPFLQQTSSAYRIMYSVLTDGRTAPPLQSREFYSLDQKLEKYWSFLLPTLKSVLRKSGPVALSYLFFLDQPCMSGVSTFSESGVFLKREPRGFIDLLFCTVHGIGDQNVSSRSFLARYRDLYGYVTKQDLEKSRKYWFQLGLLVSAALTLIAKGDSFDVQAPYYNSELPSGTKISVEDVLSYVRGMNLPENLRVLNPQMFAVFDSEVKLEK